MLPVSRTAARSAPGWRNWGGTAACTPNRVRHPASAAEIADIVRETAARGGTVKTVGAGHSFSPIAVADDVQLDLSRLRGLVARAVQADDEAIARQRVGAHAGDGRDFLQADGLGDGGQHDGEAEEEGLQELHSADSADA